MTDDSSVFWENIDEQSNIDESKIVKKLKNENDKLAKTNDEYRNQIHTLKNQFDQAIKRLNQSEQCFEKNKELENRLTELEMRKNETENRLKIALKKIDELEKNAKLLALSNIKDRMKPQCQVKSEQKEFIDKLKVMEQELNDERIKHNTLQNSTDSLLQIASQCFGSRIVDIQSLEDHIIQQHDCYLENENMKQDNFKLASAYTELKRKMKDNEYMSINSRDKFKRAFRRVSKEMRCYRNKTQELLEKNVDLAAKNEQLEAQNADLIVQIHKCSKNAIEMAENIKQKPNSDLCKANEENKQLNEKINSLNKEITDKVTYLTLQLNKKETEFNIKLNEKETNYNNVLMKARMSISKRDDEIKQLKCNIAEITSKITKWKDKYHNLESQNKHLMEKPVAETVPLSVHQEKIKQISDYERITKEQSEVIKDLQRKLEDELKKVHDLERSLSDKSYQVQELQKSQADNAIQTTVFSSVNLSKEVFDYVSEVIQNPKTSLQLKISMILRAITDSYNITSQNALAEKAQLEKQYNHVNEKLQNITQFFSRLYAHLPINFDKLVDEGASREKLLAFVIEREREYNTLKSSHQELEQTVQSVINVLGARSLDEIKDIFKKFNCLVETYKKRAKKSEHILQQSSSKENELKILVEKAEMRVHELNKYLEVNESERQEHLHKIKKLSHQIELLKLANQDKTLRDEIKVHKKKVKELEDLNSDLSTKLKEIENLLKLSQEENAKLSSGLKREKKHCHSAKEEMNAVSEKLVQKIYTINNKMKARRIKHNKEKASLLDQLQRQTIESENSIRELQSRITKLEMELSEAVSRSAELVARAQTSETRAQQIAAEKEREKRAIENKLNAKMMQTVNDLKGRIEEEKINIDLEKRNMIQMLIHSFPFVFDGTLDINSDNFPHFIELLKNKFDSLINREASIRATLGIGSRRSIESAINELKETAMDRSEHTEL